MGTVWQAYDELVERDVAVKQPRLPGDPEDEHRRRAAHRLYRAARVDHPAAVSIHDFVVEEGGLPWIVMELIRGESLHEVLQRGPVEASEAARIGLAVLGALDAAHAAGIVHRDVEPANVLLGDARTQYTRTTFHGYEAVQADTSYGLDGTLARVMQLMIRTDDGRMYELRVDMPKGTPGGKQGTALFKGARDRLVLGKS